MRSAENAEKCIFGDELIVIPRTTPTQPTAEVREGSDPEHFSATDASNQQSLPNYPIESTLLPS